MRLWSHLFFCAKRDILDKIRAHFWLNCLEGITFIVVIDNQGDLDGKRIEFRKKNQF